MPETAFGRSECVKEAKMETRDWIEISVALFSIINGWAGLG